MIIKITFEEDETLIGETTIEEEDWSLSEWGTYEKAYKSGHVPGYAYNIWMERPTRKKVK